MTNYHGIPWSLVSTGAIIYFLLTMRFALRQHTNPAAKIMVQTIATQFLCLLADCVWGYHGWAVNYAIPSLLILADGLNSTLMVIHHMSWQSYLIFQVEYVLIALLLIGLCLGGLVAKPMLSVIAVIVSVSILIGSLLLGKKKARTELKRRFRI